MPRLDMQAGWMDRVRRWRDAAMRWEAPTWGLVVVIYGGWLALTWWWHALPLWVVAPAGAWLCAWHMSLQHELMHGHPTRRVWVNTMLAWPPLNVWLPYALYRDSHMRHHRAAHLTDPMEDPESSYLAAADWAQAGTGRRLLHGACNTLVGRVLVGPACTILRFWLGQARFAGRARAWRVWGGHLAGVGIVLAWVCGVCRIDLPVYLAYFVYPGTALNMVRSLAEHRAAARPEDRTAVVERAGLLGLLFLNNNLHVLHHEEPHIAWFALPERWRAAREEMLGERHGSVYRGYADVARRHAWRPLHAGPHPGATAR